VSFLENILTQLRSSGIVRSQRGPEGGYWLAHPAAEVNLADIIRAVEGPLVGVRGQRPEEIEYVGSAEALQNVWIALRANLRKVLEQVTVADVAAGKLPKEVLALTRQEEAWQTR
jgi:Rrf2 family protein